MPRPRDLRLDAIDRKLLELLQEDAARALFVLGDAVGLSPSAVQRRIARYQSTGLIARQVAVLDPEALAGTVLACVLVTLERESRRLHGGFKERLRAVPEVQQCYDLAGQWDYLVILAANGMPRCQAVLQELFLEAPNIKRYDTLFITDVVKRGLRIPVGPARGRGD